jgi:hypothetical protein
MKARDFIRVYRRPRPHRHRRVTDATGLCDRCAEPGRWGSGVTALGRCLLCGFDALVLVGARTSPGARAVRR